LVLESVARAILEDIKNNLIQHIDVVNFPEYLSTIKLLNTIENKNTQKKCKGLLILCDTKKESVKSHDKSEENDLLLYNNTGRERTETISEPSTYSPPRSPRFTHRHTMQQMPTNEKAPGLWERVFGKKVVEQSKPVLKKNNSFMLPDGIKDKETIKLRRATTTFFKIHDDKENQSPSKISSLTTGLN
jgi:hypothetical protein